MQEDSPVPNMTVDALVENLPRWPFPKITAWEWNQVDSRQRRDRKQPPALGVPPLPWLCLPGGLGGAQSRAELVHPPGYHPTPLALASTSCYQTLFCLR